MRRWTVFLLLLVLPALLREPTPAGAQEQPAIERLTVGLWPEYDRPELLVILRVQLAPGTALPAEITLPIPASADLLAVAYSDADGALLNAPYTSQAQGEWSTVTLTTETLNAQLEYYQPMESSGTERSFAYAWPGGQDLASLGYEVQHPVGSEAMTIDPPAQSTTPRPDGLVYSVADLGSVAAMETREILVSYQRDASTLTIDTLPQPVPPVAGPSEPAAAGLDVTAALPWGLGAVGLGLVAVGGVLFWRSRRRSPVASTRERHPPRRKEAEAEGLSLDASVVFCHNCGTQAGVSDRFCRQCGTKLRG